MPSGQKKMGKLLISHRSTAYPCSLPGLGEFSRSWSYKTYPLQKYNDFGAVTSNHTVFFFFHSELVCLQHVIMAECMYKNVHFWVVIFLSGLFGGLLIFVLLFTFNLLLNSYFSFLYLFIYLSPLVVMHFATTRLRDFFGQGVMSMKQAFVTAFSAGFLSALVMSLTIYFVYAYLNSPALEHRFSTLEAEMLRQGNMEELRQKRQLLRSLINPKSMAIYFGAVNLLLLPLYAFLIAIFAKRKNKYLDPAQ